jgi:hypothetical protein
MARKAKRIRFVVGGLGQFPYDMLRYDACWPEQEADAPKLAADWASGYREVTLLTDAERGPTDRRWMAHTWKVIATEYVV